MGQYVGIDLRRRSTTIVRMAEDGEVLGTERFVSQPFELAQAMAAAGPEPEVVLESTYGWYWAADLLQDLGAHVHLAHALGNNWGPTRRERRARRPGPRRHVGPRASGRGLDRAVRGPRAARAGAYRYSLIRHRTSANAQIHGVMAKNGILPVVGELWGPTGQAQLDRSRTPRGLCDPPRLAAQPARRLRAFDRRARRAHPRPAQGGLRLSGRHDPARGGQGHRGDAAGPGSPPSTASPTRSSTAGRSPSRVRHSCAGRPSRRSATTGPKATRSCAPTTSASPSTPARTRLVSRWPASS